MARGLRTRRPAWSGRGTSSSSVKSKGIQSATVAAGDTRAEALRRAIGSVPPGAWAGGASAGGESIAVLPLLHERRDLRLHVAHLNHQTRGEASAGDAAFVAEL